jgi:ABC-type antimicrobial peptide transport system permease subunit
MRAREAGAARWFATILTYAGWGGLVLAVIGMVAVMRLWIAGAVPELALRRAVGARRRHVLGRVALRALAVIGGGAALTWWLEPVAAAALAQAVPGLPAGAPALVAGPFVILTVATLAAVAGPAWRTAPTDR